MLRSWYTKLRRWGAGLKGPLRYQISRLANSPDAYLKLCTSGVIHVGANRGHERFLYAENRLKVVWIEPLPEIFDQLRHNIEPYADQRALNALITDRDGDVYTLHISNNAGESSSIFDLHHHKDLWPDVHYVGDIVLTSVTLKTALEEHAISPGEYEVLAIDVQGSELMVLKGAEDILPCFKYIKSEAADFEVYKNGCTADQITAYLETRGFRLMRKDAFARRAAGGACFDLLFARNL
jgi:2-O-methyltransferase